MRCVGRGSETRGFEAMVKGVVMGKVIAVLVAMGLGGMVAGGEVAGWEFEGAGDFEGWEANGHVGEAAVRDGGLAGKGVGSDPFFSLRDVNFAAEANQYVKMRVKADESGEFSLFWSGTFEGENGGLSEGKKTVFGVKGDGEWHEVAGFPFWQGEGRIRQMRLDVYEGSFEVDWIRVVERNVGKAEQSGGRLR